MNGLHFVIYGKKRERILFSLLVFIVSSSHSVHHSFSPIFFEHLPGTALDAEDSWKVR